MNQSCPMSDEQMTVEEKSTEGQGRQRSFITTPGTIADQLRQRLLALEYPAFALCLCVLLEALGYKDARPAGRQEWRGYNRPGGGGYDLKAILPGGLTPRQVVAQIKQFDDLNVFQRSVDELRGACLRCGAAEAILMTTSAFSKVVLKHAAALDAFGSPVAPVRLIDGKKLLALMISHRLGIRETVRSQEYRLELDEAFFKHLSAFKPEVSSKETAEPPQKASKSQQTKNSNEDLRWKMTIYLSGNGELTEENTVRGKLRRGGR